MTTTYRTSRPVPSLATLIARMSAAQDTADHLRNLAEVARNTGNEVLADEAVRLERMAEEYEADSIDQMDLIAENYRLGQFEAAMASR
jgi:hypothetical protein